jgi:hypothetical protein
MRDVDVFVGALVTIGKESFPGKQVYSVEEIAHKKQIVRLGKIADGEKHDAGWFPFSCLKPANYDETRSWAEAIRHREKDGNPPESQEDSPPTDDPDTTMTEELVERVRNHKTLIDSPGIEMIKKQIEEELGKLRRELLDAAVGDSGPCYAERIVFGEMFTVLSDVDVTNCEEQFPALEDYCKELANADDRKIIWNCIDRIKRLLLVWDRVNNWLNKKEN